jgi:hypothetical protein
MYQHGERQSREENNSPVGEVAKELFAMSQGRRTKLEKWGLKTVLTVSTCAEPVTRPNRLDGS